MKTPELEHDINIILRGAGTGIVLKAIGAVAEFLYTILLSRMMGIDTLGFYFFGFSIYRFVRALNVRGLDYTARRFVLNTKNIKNLFIIFFQRWVEVTVIVYLSLIIFIPINNTYSVLDIFRFKSTVWFVAIAPLGAFISIIASIFQGLKKIKLSCYLQDTIPPLSRIVFLIPLVWLGQEFRAPYLAYLLSLLSVCILSLFWFSNMKVELIPEDVIKNKSKIDIDKKKISIYSTPMMITTLINLITIWGVTFLLGVRSTPDQVSLYAISTRILMIINLFLISINSIYEPVCAELFFQNKRRELINVYRQTTGIILMVLIPGILVGITVSQPIMNLFGSGFADEKMLLIILMVSQFFGAFIGPAGSTLVMGGYQKDFIKINYLIAIIVTVASIVFLQKYGALSAAIITGSSIIIRHILSALVLYIKEQIHPFSKNSTLFLSIGIIGTLFAVIWNNTTLGYITITVVIFSLFTFGFLKGYHRMLPGIIGR